MPRSRRPVRIALFTVIGMLIGMLLAASEPIRPKASTAN